MADAAKGSAEQIDVAYVAHLARLYLTEAERETFQGQMEQIVHYVRKIGELDLTGIEPTSHAHPVQNVFRNDEVAAGLDHEQVMNNAPSHVNGLFSVPKIVE